MAELIGMVQILAVYHYGYYTLKDRTVQFHEPKHVPSDAEAVLEWGLNTPFSSQDKPPLAIAMVVTVNGVRSLKRFRLVIAQKSEAESAEDNENAPPEEPWCQPHRPWTTLRNKKSKVLRTSWPL